MRSLIRNWFDTPCSGQDEHTRIDYISVRRTRYAIILALSLLALSTRLIPLAISPFPFNNDGITESRIAEDIISSRGLSYPDGAFYVDTHSLLTVAFDLILAYAALTLGTSPFWVAQSLAAIFSALSIVGAYAIVLRITSNCPAAILSSYVLALFGSFVYLSGSAWKESLGVALIILAVFLYMRRDDMRMFILNVAVLLVLPITHHLVTAIVYLAVWYLTLLSLVFALKKKSLRLRHVRDLVAISVVTTVAFGYYFSNSLDRLTHVDSYSEILPIGVVLVIALAGTYVVLTRKSRFRTSFAPIPATLVVCLFTIDFFNPIFGYTQGTPIYAFLLAGVMAVIVGVGWYGMENLVESCSRYRSIPLGLLLPALLFLFIAVFLESGITSHWLFYRTYDFSVIPLAIGVGAAYATIRLKSRRRTIVALVLLVALIASFPYGYATDVLTGVRHDTQSYEIDAISWAFDACGDRIDFQSDERLSYNAQALFDFPKDPLLPVMLSEKQELEPGCMHLFLEEWYTIGVNAYPHGRVYLDRTYVLDVMDECNVIYVGGPVDNQATVFES